MVRGGAGNADGQPPGHVDDLASSLQEVTGVYPDASLMARALTHRSFAYEHGGLPHNERLEFLGDSVLGLVVTDHLYDAHPDLTEGQLARLRAAVVNMRALADVGRTLGLGDYLFLGRGEESTGAATRTRSSRTPSSRSSGPCTSRVGCRPRPHSCTTSWTRS